MVSLRPSNFVEGGAVPVDRNLTWKECRFNLFDYTRKTGEVVATTVAARITYVDDDGAEFVQQYSAGDPERFTPSPDGKKLVAVGTALSLSKSSNFYLLLNALINAGFPENRLDEDISSLDGLYTHNVGMPEPTRVGLVRPAVAGEAARPRVISIPDQILRLPWEKKAGKSGVAPKTVTRTKQDKSNEGEGDGDTSGVSGKAMKLVEKALAENDVVTRQQLAVRLFKDLAKDPDKDAVARLIFQPEFQGALLAGGYAIDGENISKAG